MEPACGFNFAENVSEFIGHLQSFEFSSDFENFLNFSLRVFEKVLSSKNFNLAKVDGSLKNKEKDLIMIVKMTQFWRFWIQPTTLQSMMNAKLSLHGF